MIWVNGNFSKVFIGWYTPDKKDQHLPISEGWRALKLPLMLILVLESVESWCQNLWIQLKLSSNISCGHPCKKTNLRCKTFNLPKNIWDGDTMFHHLPHLLRHCWWKFTSSAVEHPPPSFYRWAETLAFCQRWVWGKFPEHWVGGIELLFTGAGSHQRGKEGNIAWTFQDGDGVDDDILEKFRNDVEDDAVGSVE